MYAYLFSSVKKEKEAESKKKNILTRRIYYYSEMKNTLRE